MARKSNVEGHARRQEVEIGLVARVPLAVLSARFGLSIFSLYRWRKHMRENEFAYYHSIKRALAAKNLTRKTIQQKWESQPCQ